MPFFGYFIRIRVGPARDRETLTVPVRTLELSYCFAHMNSSEGVPPFYSDDLTPPERKSRLAVQLHENEQQHRAPAPVPKPL